MLTLLSGYGISRLEVENRFIDYFKSDTEIYRGMEVIDTSLGGTTPLRYYFAGTKFCSAIGCSDDEYDIDDEYDLDDEFDDYGEIDEYGDILKLRRC